MTPQEAAWIRAHVLAPRRIPAQQELCPCQITSNACARGEHGTCGHDQWVAWGGTEPETIVGRGSGPFPCAGAFGLHRGDATVYLADRSCHTRCNCHCHQPLPPGAPVPCGQQLDLFA